MNALEFAINMEIDGEKYYTDQAKKNKGNSLEKVLLMLAADEKKHADLLRKELEETSYVLTEDYKLDDAVNVFKNQEELRSLKDKPDQLDVYKIALENEEKSINLYNEFYKKANVESEKSLFHFLVKEEEKHFNVIKNIVLELNKAHDWVESAEFGFRKEDY